MTDEGHSPNLPTEDQIIAALDRTGFILEHRVYQTLSDFEFDCFLNDAFQDPETGKSREIDVAIANKPSSGKDKTQVIISVNLMIECKNYSDPLAIIGHDVGHGIQHAKPLISPDPLSFQFANRDPKINGAIVNELRLWSEASHNTYGFVGTQLVRMHRQGGKWQATNDSVHVWRIQRSKFPCVAGSLPITRQLAVSGERPRTPPVQPIR